LKKGVTVILTLDEIEEFKKLTRIVPDKPAFKDQARLLQK
jgi:hypothetical protein